MKNQRNTFIEAMLIVHGKVSLLDIVETFAMKEGSARSALFEFVRENPSLADKNRGDDFIVRVGKSMKSFTVKEKDAKPLLAAFEVIRSQQDSSDRQVLRYAYIEAVLIKNNKIGRDEIARAFELAGAAATRTMQDYVIAAEGNAELHARRYYVKGENFTPKFLDGASENQEEAADKIIKALEHIVGDHILDPTLSKMWRKERGKEEKVRRIYRR
tara:strand:- start:3686 stop:4330 length:645 start_codon:yes stop_codon:yes gene_type:complete